MMRPNQVETG